MCDSFVFQPDNDPKQTSGLCKNYSSKKESDDLCSTITRSKSSSDLGCVEPESEGKLAKSTQHLQELL